MGAMEKTAQLLRMSECPLSLLEKNEKNPNKMRSREFDLLVDNMNRTGWTDAALARPLDRKLMLKLVEQHGKDEQALSKAMLQHNVRLRIVGGHHRFDAASFLGFEAGPVTVILDSDFDEEQENFQLVRMNVIHGRMDPQAFLKLYEEVAEKYSDDILQDAFGFADEAEFKRLKAQMAKQLPDKASQDKFIEAAAEIKTVDGLSKLLNQIFTKYGNTLPFGYLVFEYGNQKSMWLRVDNKTFKALEIVGHMCIDHDRTMDAVVGHVMQLIAKNESPDFFKGVVKATPEVKLPKGFALMPTKDNLAEVEAL